MPEVSSDSDSEPDLSILAMARGPIGAVAATPEQQQHLQQLQRMQQIQQIQAAEEAMAQEQYEAEDTSVEEQVDEEVETEEEGEEDAEDHEDGPQLGDPTAAGLKEISNLGKFTVSSHKPGNGVDELRSDDTKAYWQYDPLDMKYLALDQITNELVQIGRAATTQADSLFRQTRRHPRYSVLRQLQ